MPNDPVCFLLHGRGKPFQGNVYLLSLFAKTWTPSMSPFPFAADLVHTHATGWIWPSVPESIFSHWHGYDSKQNSQTAGRQSCQNVLRIAEERQRFPPLDGESQQSCSEWFHFCRVNLNFGQGSVNCGFSLLSDSVFFVSHLTNPFEREKVEEAVRCTNVLLALFRLSVRWPTTRRAFLEVTRQMWTSSTPPHRGMHSEILVSLDSICFPRLTGFRLRVGLKNVSILVETKLTTTEVEQQQFICVCSYSGEIAALAPGCFDPKCETTLLEDVTRAVIGSDVTVVCLGTGKSTLMKTRGTMLKAWAIAQLLNQNNLCIFLHSRRDLCFQNKDQNLLGFSVLEAQKCMHINLWKDWHPKIVSIYFTKVPQWNRKT